MDRGECLRRLGTIPRKQSPRFATVEVELGGETRPIDLLFDSHDRLDRIELDLHVSRDFWDNYAPGEMDHLGTEYRRRYEQVCNGVISFLGPPAFAGQWGTNGYPDEQGAAEITYWDRPEGRLQVEFDHPDRELPFFVRLSAYRLPGI